MNWQRMCPEFLKKRLFRYLLQHFLGSFFKEKLSLEQLTINMYSGIATVEQLHLDHDFLNEKLNKIFQSEMPIEIVNGFVGHLSVNIPWHDLINEDCKLIVKDIQILIRTKNVSKHNNVKTINSMFNSLEKSSMLIDSIMKTSVHIAQECLVQQPNDPTTEPEFIDNQTNLLGLEAFASTIDSILSRIKIKLENVEIRIEHHLEAATPAETSSQEFMSGVAFELKIDSLQYFDIISQHLTRSFQIDGIAIYFNEFIISTKNNEYASLNASTKNDQLEEIINIKEKVQLLSIDGTQSIQLTINNLTPNLLFELNAQIDSAKIILNVNHINTIIDIFNKFSTSHSNESFLMNSDIYYSLLNQDDDTVNIECDPLTVEPEKIISIIKNDQNVKKLNAFKFNINMINLILMNNEKLKFDQIASKYFDNHNIFDHNFHHFLIELKSISIDSFQKEKLTYSMTESNIRIQTFNIKEYLTAKYETILELNKDILTIEFIAYEPNNETNNNLIYNNKFENTSVQIKPLINLDVSILNRFQKFFKNIKTLNTKNKDNNFTKKNFDIKCESIKLIINKELIAELIDFNLKKSSFEEFKFKFFDMKFHFQNFQFISIKSIQGCIKNKSLVFKTKNSNRIDSLETKFNINFNKPNQFNQNNNDDNDNENDFSPFSKVYSLISNETNSRIVKTGNKSEIDSFKTYSKSNANSIFDLTIDLIQIKFKEKKFLANFVSFISSLNHSDNQNDKKLNNNELLLIINVNSAQIKAFVINELNYSEFDLNLNGIEICSSISNQNLISLLIHQFKLFHSLKTDLNNKNNNVESSSSSSQEDMIISRNNNSMLSNPMISIGLKSKLKKSLIAIDFDSLCLNQKFTEKSNEIWLNQLLRLFELIEQNDDNNQNELHVNISNSCIYYKPINLNLESMISFKYFHFSMVNNHQDDSNLFIFNLEDIDLFISRNNVNNINLATSNQFELVLKTKKLKPFIELTITSSSVYFKTCLDSTQALIELISYICKNGDRVIISNENDSKNVKIKVNKNENFNELESLPDPLLYDYQIIESTNTNIDNIDQLGDDCEYEIKTFEKKSPVLIKEDYFKPSLVGFDLLKTPDWLTPVSVNQYSIQDLTLNWTLFIGSDFQQNRSLNENMQISIIKLKTRIDLFDETDYLYRIALTIGDIKIKDALSSSNYNMFLYRYESNQCPRRTQSSMIFVKFLCSKSKTKHNQFEIESKVAVQPLRFNLDQDALIFLHEFFSQLIPIETVQVENSPTATSSYQSEIIYESNILIKKFIFSPCLLIRFDFNGKYDNKSESSSIAKLLMPAVQLSNTEIKLKPIFLENIKSEFLIDQLKDTWFNDIKQYQVMNLLKGWSLFTSVFQFCEGFTYLFSYPLEQYCRDGRLIYGIRKGGAAFSHSTVMATLDSTNKFFSTTKTLTDFIYNLVKIPARKQKSIKQKTQPNDFREGINNALDAINDTAAEFIQEIIIKDNLTNPIGAISGCLSTALVPIVITANAAYNISTGIRNQFSPDEKKDSDQKWK